MYLPFKGLKQIVRKVNYGDKAKSKVRLIFFEFKMEHARCRWSNY